MAILVERSCHRQNISSGAGEYPEPFMNKKQFHILVESIAKFTVSKVEAA